VSALPSIAQLQVRPAQADAAADLYARHSQRIFGYCLGLLRNREEAEDAVQTTFLNAYQGLRRGVRPEFEAAWLFKIAQNVCRTRRETAWRHGKVETIWDLDSLQDVVAAPERPQGDAAALTEALKRMPERYRTIILLREWQGLSYREIAAKLELSDAAVEMLVFRARRSLAENLEQVDGPRSRALSVSSFVSLLKSLLGGAALKTAVTAAVAVTAIAVATGDSEHALPVQPAHVTPAAVPRDGAAVPPVETPGNASPRRLQPGTASSGGTTPSAAPAAPPVASISPTTGGALSSPPASSRPAPPAAASPTVSVPPVSVPDAPISTPTVTVPSVQLTQTPPLQVKPPDLPVTLPELPHLP
jgi:RNA polymerase sigma-70 factor (ECF subfamily)